MERKNQQIEEKEFKNNNLENNLEEYKKNNAKLKNDIRRANKNVESIY